MARPALRGTVSAGGPEERAMEVMVEVIHILTLNAMMAGWILLWLGLAVMSGLWVIGLWTARS